MVNVFSPCYILPKIGANSIRVKWPAMKPCKGLIDSVDTIIQKVPEDASIGATANFLTVTSNDKTTSDRKSMQ